MRTDCSAKLFGFKAVERRAVVASFDGGDITSNAGALLLGQVDGGLGLIRRFAQCFDDRRNPVYVEHRLETLLAQRIFGLALGYEDLNDHDELRKDSSFAVLAGKLEPALRSDCEALAGKSTLNRLEHTPKRHAAKYHKIDRDARGSMACRSTSPWKPTNARRARSCSISTIPTFRFTADKRVDFSTTITTNIAICRCMSFVDGICCWRRAACRCRRQRWRGRGHGAHRFTHSPELATGTHHFARRQRLFQ